jgi:hypothetical protein
MGTTDATDWRAHVDKALSEAERSLGIAGSPQKASRRPYAGQLGRSDAYGPPASGGHSLVLPSAFRADGGSAGAVPADIDLNEKEDEEEEDGEDISEEDLVDVSSLDEEGDVE